MSFENALLLKETNETCSLVFHEFYGPNGLSWSLNCELKEYTCNKLLRKLKNDK